MEIQECSLPGFYCSRFLGLAPYLISRDKKNRIDEIRRSPWLCLYSIFLMVATVSLTVRFIFVDAVSKEIKRRTATSKFVTTFDVSVVMGACLFGSITGLLGKRLIQRINANLSKADDELILFNQQKDGKKRNITLLAIVFSIMTAMLIMDFIAKWRTAHLTKKSQQEPTDYMQILSSLPFYTLYYILMALHTQIAQTALGIQRRYFRLNLAMQNIFSLENLMGTGNRLNSNVLDGKDSMPTQTNDETPIPATKMQPLHAALKPNDTAPTLNTDKYLMSVSTTAFGKFATTATALKRASLSLDRLSYTHAILGETVTLISKTFGMTILAMLASCLLHLVATIYFLFIGLLGDPDWFVASLQLIWCCFHSSRLLLIVEPCHMATLEANRTLIIVGEAMRNCKESAVEPLLQRFWQQLIADNTYYFTACGLCTVDRAILTSAASAITIYLVILIQFQRTDQ